MPHKILITRALQVDVVEKVTGRAIYTDGMPRPGNLCRAFQCIPILIHERTQPENPRSPTCEH